MESPYSDNSNSTEAQTIIKMIATLQDDVNNECTIYSVEAIPKADGKQKGIKTILSREEHGDLV